MSVSNLSANERIAAAAWALLAVAGLAYAALSDIGWFSSEFFSLLALVALFCGFALAPSFMFRPLRESLGEAMERPLKFAFGFFCAFQSIAILMRIL